MRLLCTLLLLMSLPAGLTAAQQDVLGFARHLVASGEYYRAITEYKRYLYSLAPEDEQRPHVRVEMVLAYFAGGQLDQGLHSLEDMMLERHAAAAPAVAEAGRLLFDAGRYGEARAYLEFYYGTWPSEAQLGEVTARLSAVYLALDQRQLALELDPRLNASIEDISISRKSLPLAGSLSAVLPGAGQLYAGRPVDAAVAFTVNLIFLGATVSAVDAGHTLLAAGVGVFGIGWYGGNIFNAINSARLHNQQAVDDAVRDYYEQRRPVMGVGWQQRF
ncbi:tetratricopeptide TPR_2 repeat protein [Desulfurispirillum indicum S5]|uniref:Tetratricopeptide TPR_2 repeat protein n=1 Tax=Desulfurispirillum indicum (strain ATCC BAA-1389 / DSM 22839 / S5) TaxID=653733 RepID=E6W4H2_DESIS|nr:hypothetical protein [Desulfurispirillum indicum]ADU65946.1 tetratricopeptide TPR_2 repeat protein [Desulfurispirillum indicum S5]